MTKSPLMYYRYVDLPLLYLHNWVVIFICFKAFFSFALSFQPSIRQFCVLFVIQLKKQGRPLLVLEELNILHLHFHWTRLVVGVDVRHQGVPRAIDSLTNDATILFLSFRVLISDMSFQRGFRA